MTTETHWEPTSHPPEHPTAHCGEAQDRIAGAFGLDELDARTLDHAETCAACGPFLERYRQLAIVTLRARRAADREPELSPAAWAELRARVDARVARGRWAWLSWGLGAVALAGAAALAFVLTRPPEPSVDVMSARGLSGARDNILVLARAAIDAPPPALEAGSALALGAGSYLQSGDEPRAISAFGRHRIDLAPRSLVRVAQWSPGQMELVVELGRATFEVERATATETFDVWAGDLGVHVKGTIFTVENTGKGEARVSVERGKVTVQRKARAASVGEPAAPEPESVAVAAGERLVVPIAVEGAPGEPQPKAPKPGKPERVLDVAPGAQNQAPGPESASIANMIPPIFAAVRAGRCVSALNALDDLTRDKAVGAALPRSALWLTAYCRRRLGDIDSSRRLFEAYGTAGPWAVPTGDELPPLP